MTEYWKSNARKFCDYCQCWFADNKPSIDFHEAGKKHKENVAKKLREIGKKGREDYENSQKMSDYMKEMEEAALKAYKEDIGANPDLTGSSIADIAKQQNADIVVKSSSNISKKEQTPKEKNTKWYEAKSPSGQFYYYHTETKETRWDSPKEGYISIKEQNAQKEKKKAMKKEKKASKPREEEKHTINKNNQPVASHSQNAQSSYGSWVTVEKPVMPDLQLPKVPGEEYSEDDYIPFPKPAHHNFTQKTVTLGETSTSTDFKKRKNTDQYKKNARVRTNDL